MKRLFVPYKLASQLKEKGFNEKCFTWYLNKKLEEDSTKFFFFTHSYRSHEGSKNVPAEKFVSAPLYQQVIDWFRKRHIRIVESPTSFDGSWLIILDTKAPNKLKKNYEFQGFLSLDKTIEEALKLI